MFARSALAFWKARRIAMIPADTFAAPTPTSCSPSSVAVAGGTLCTIAGADLAHATSVRFGGVLATSLVVVSDVAITCVAPAHALGAVPLHVYGLGGQGVPITVTYAAAGDARDTEAGDARVTEAGDARVTES